MVIEFSALVTELVSNSSFRYSSEAQIPCMLFLKSSDSSRFLSDSLVTSSLSLEELNPCFESPHDRTRAKNAIYNIILIDLILSDGSA